MKTKYITMSLILSIIISLSFSCDPNGKQKQEYTKLDSIWLPFANAMETKDIEFLLKNSLDTITCYDCFIDSANQQEYFNSEFIFRNYLSKVMHLPTLTDRVFSTYQADSNLIRIGYTVESFDAPEGSYGLFFTLVRKGKKYYFQGMMVQ